MKKLLEVFSLFSFGVLFLCQCATKPVIDSSNRRASSLSQLGYEAIPLLNKVKKDKRLSQEFLVNSRKVHFLIDTGATMTSLKERLEWPLGLLRNESHNRIVTSAFGQSMETPTAYGTLQIGKTITSRKLFELAPFTENENSRKQYGGLLGVDALIASGALIDLENSALWIPRHQPSNHQLAKITKHSVSISPMPGNQLLSITTLVKGQRLVWQLDTGSEVSLLQTNKAKSLALKLETTPYRVIDTSGTVLHSKKATLPSLQCGSLVVQNLTTQVVPLWQGDQKLLNQRGERVNGILGIDFLRHTKALIDPQNNKIYFGSR